MSLHVYTSRDDVPKELGRVIDYNDMYFNGQLLEDISLVRKILAHVDKAQYQSPMYFIGRDPDLGGLDKSCLSTGCKTLLNVLLNPDKCFDIRGCGTNALELLPLLTSGHVLWGDVLVTDIITDECDIEWNGGHYSSFEEFLDTITED